MAEKPTRKTPAKRGPTRAAALKALGLTQEDLDALKELRYQNELREKVLAQQLAVKKHDEATETYVYDERYAVVGEDHTAEGGPDLRGRVPLSTVEEVRALRTAQDEARANAEPVPAAQPTVKVEIPQTPQVPTWYIRNLRNMEVNFRLTRQDKQGERRTMLKPRGQRGDIIRLDQGDLNDSALQTQVAYGLVEILPEGEALEVIRKQSVNSQMGAHPALAMLTNERGEHYDQGAVRMASDEEAFGYKVADLKPIVEGELGEIQVNRGGIQRDLSQAQNVAQPGGNPRIISDGFAPVQTDANLGGIDPNAVAKDAIARAKNIEGPAAGLGNVQVTVGEVQKT